MKISSCMVIICGLLVPQRCLAQDAAAPGESRHETAADSSYSVEPAYKFIFGTDRYRNSDIFIDVDMPNDFSLDADYNFYQSDVSSATKIYSLGANKSFGPYSFGVSYTLEPRQNDFKSDTFGLNGSFHTDSGDFRTTLTARADFTDDVQYIGISTATKNMKITQSAGSLGVKQQFYDTRIKAEVIGYNYSPDIKSYSLEMARWEAKFNKAHPKKFNLLSGALGGATGLLTGYPGWSARFTVYQDIDALPLPVTLWSKYENTHFLAAYQYQPPALPINSLVSGITADSVTFGLDLDFGGQVSGTLQYNRVRETGQTTQDLYGAILSARF